MDAPVNNDAFSGNMIRPFQLESSSLRGRIVRFNSVMDDILVPHDYPDIVRQLLGETITLCSLLSSMLKFEGIFTLQTSGDGAISMLVSDVTSKGDIRGCASFNEEKVAALEKIENPTLNDMLGEGYIAFTVDQGEFAERYQGIVELKGETLTDCVQHYFTQSEQIDTAIKIGVGQRDNKWRAAGMMIQHMPVEGGHKGETVVNMKEHLDEDDWRRASILMESCKEEELLSADLNSHDILMRLFHEEGVRVFEPTPLQHQCRCSNQKVKNVFGMLTVEEREDMVVDGKVTMTCEFCSKNYEFSKDELEVMIDEKTCSDVEGGDS